MTGGALASAATGTGGVAERTLAFIRNLRLAGGGSGGGGDGGGGVGGLGGDKGGAGGMDGVAMFWAASSPLFTAFIEITPAVITPAATAVPQRPNAMSAPRSVIVVLSSNTLHELGN